MNFASLSLSVARSVRPIQPAGSAPPATLWVGSFAPCAASGAAASARSESVVSVRRIMSAILRWCEGSSGVTSGRRHELPRDFAQLGGMPLLVAGHEQNPLVQIELAEPVLHLLDRAERQPVA